MVILRIFSQDTFIYNYNLFLYISGDFPTITKISQFRNLNKMAGRKPTPINLKSTSPEGVVRTFKSIPEAARELGISEAAVKKAKYSNRNRIGENQLEWLEPKPEKPAFNKLERVKSNKTKNCFICGEPLETEDHFSFHWIISPLKN